MKNIKKITKVAKGLGWAVQNDNNEITFSKYSPAGQDFSVTITSNDLNEIIDQLQERCDNFDCSEETYLWLDNTGHGRNGAPYDMKDLYEDMEACLEMMEELCDKLQEAEKQ